MDSSTRDFGREVITLIRDPAVVELDRLLSGRYKGKQAAVWREETQNPVVLEGFERLGPDIVDLVVFRILDLVDEGALDIVFPDSGLRASDDVRGEYAGWFEGAPGWRHGFAKERFNDYYSEDDATESESPAP